MLAVVLLVVFAVRLLVTWPGALVKLNVATLDTPEKIAAHLARLAELEREFFTRTGRLRG